MTAQEAEPCAQRTSEGVPAASTEGQGAPSAALPSMALALEPGCAAPVCEAGAPCTDGTQQPAQPVAAGKKRVKIFGMTFAATEKSCKFAVVGAGTALLLMNGIGLPFVLPRVSKKLSGASFVSMRMGTVGTLFDRVLPAWAASRAASPGGPAAGLAGLRLVDFGAGDGRIVRSAASRGMHATGLELNPWLVLWSMFRPGVPTAAAGGSADLRWANAWSSSLRDADVVTIYSRPGSGVLERVAAKCEAELPSSAVVVSHLWDVPGWERMLVQDVDDLKVYDFSRRGGVVAGVE